MREQRKLKTIAFDLDTKALQEHYPKGDWHSAYADIATFLGKQHFTHSQGSVYDSTTPFSDRELGDLIQTMGDTLTWLPHCIKSIRGYDQPVMIDYTQQLKDNIEQNLELASKKESNKESSIAQSQNADSKQVSPKETNTQGISPSESTLSKMKQKIAEFEKSGKLDEITRKRDKGKDKGR